MSPTCNTLRRDRVGIMNLQNTAFGPNSGSNKGFFCYNRTFIPPLGLPKIPCAIIKGYMLRDIKTRLVISRILGQRAKTRKSLQIQNFAEKTRTALLNSVSPAFT